MALIIPEQPKNLILELELPNWQPRFDITVKNITTGKSLTLNFGDEWPLPPYPVTGGWIVLNFTKQSITSKTGEDFSKYLSPTDNSLWTSEPAIAGVNDLSIYVNGASPDSYDLFLQTESNLTTRGVGQGTGVENGVYEGFGDAVDFKIIAASDLVRRTETLDAANQGRLALAGALGGNQQFGRTRINVKASAKVEGQLRMGPVVKGTNNNNYVAAVLGNEAGKKTQFSVITLIAGVAKIQNFVAESTSPLWENNKWYTVEIDIGFEGIFSGYYEARFGLKPEAPPNPIPLSAAVPQLPTLSGIIPELAEGFLPEGKQGFYDQNTGATACTREYKYFCANRPGISGPFGTSVNRKATIRWEKAEH